MICVTVPDVSIVSGIAVACNVVITKNAVYPPLIVYTGIVYWLGVDGPSVDGRRNVWREILPARAVEGA